MLLSYIPDKNKIKDFQEIEETFFKKDFAAVENRDEIYKQLNSFFSKASVSDILEFKNTYWKLFVYATWKLFNTRSVEELNKIISLQVPDALDLDIDVLDKIIWHLGLVYFDIYDQKEVYEKIKESFFSSEMIFGYDENNQPVTINKVVNDIVKLDLAGNDSLEEAKLLRQMNSMRVNNNIFTKFITIDQSLSVKNFFDLVHFFIGVGVDDIPYIVYSFLTVDPEISSRGGSVGNVIIYNKVNAERKKDNGMAEWEEKPFLAELPKHKSDFVGWVASATVLRSLLIWLRSFENKGEARRALAENLAKVLGDESLKNSDLVLAVAHLDEFLVKNGYVGEDFMHYEEQEGRFKWGK